MKKTFEINSAQIVLEIKQVKVKWNGRCSTVKTVFAFINQLVLEYSFNQNFKSMPILCVIWAGLLNYKTSKSSIHSKSYQHHTHICLSETKFVSYTSLIRIISNVL